MSDRTNNPKIVSRITGRNETIAVTDDMVKILCHILGGVGIRISANAATNRRRIRVSVCQPSVVDASTPKQKHGIFRFRTRLSTTATANEENIATASTLATRTHAPAKRRAPMPSSASGKIGPYQRANLGGSTRYCCTPATNVVRSPSLPTPATTRVRPSMRQRVSATDANEAPIAEFSSASVFPTVL